MFANSNQQCCNAAGARALYDAWYYAVEDDGSAFRVNLHLARRHSVASVRVENDGTYETVVVQMEKARNHLKLRLPEFVSAQELSVTIGGQALPVREERGFVDVGKVSAGCTVCFSWPLKACTTCERIAPGEFTFHWKGATVISAEPVQKLHPLFNPERFETGSVRDEPLATVELAPL